MIYQPLDPIDTVVSFLLNTNHRDTAIQCLDAFAKHAVTPGQHDQIAKLYHDCKEYKKSADMLNAALATCSSQQEMFAFRANLAKLYNNLNQPLQALTMLEWNQPHLFDPISRGEHMLETAFSTYLLGDMAKARTITEEIISHKDLPQHIKDRARFNLGTYQMDAGDFKAGIRNFIDVGHQIGVWKNKTPVVDGLIEWDGEPFTGTLVIVAEGGIGDEFINARFVNLIEKKGINVVWLTSRQQIADVFNRNGIHTVTSMDQIKESRDTMQWAFSFYLPILLDLDAEQINVGPYITPDQNRVAKWESTFRNKKSPRIGLRWAGNPDYEHNLHRSIPLDTLLGKIGEKALKGKIKVSLQRDTNTDELYPHPTIINAGDDLHDLEDLIALMSVLDCTVTSCTSVAHVGGAIGATVVVCPPISCYYTWLGEPGTWYDADKMTVVRQTEHNSFEHLNALSEIIDNVQAHRA